MKITNRTGENATEITLDMMHDRRELPCEIKKCYFKRKYFDQNDFGASYDLVCVNKKRIYKIKNNIG